MIQYPPAEAIEPQLQLIKSMIPPIIKTYQATKDAGAIQTSLDSIQHIINYLRGVEVEDPEEETNEIPYVIEAPESMEHIITELSPTHYIIELKDLAAKPHISDKDLFGDISNAIEVTLYMPIICGKTFTIKQVNKMLEIYNGKDEYIHQDENGNWYKEKNYTIYDSDTMLYSFLIGTGRNTITIIFDDITIDVITHIHFTEE